MPKLIKGRCQNWYWNKSWTWSKIMGFWTANHVKTLQQQCLFVFLRSNRLRVRTERVSNTHQTMVPTLIPKSIKHLCRIYVRKVMPKEWKHMPKWSRAGRQLDERNEKDMSGTIMFYVKTKHIRGRRSSRRGPPGQLLIREISTGGNLRRKSKQ